MILNFANSTDTFLNIRLRVGGSDNSTSNSYISQIFQTSSTATSNQRVTGTLWDRFDAPSIRNGITFDLFNPFETLVTTGAAACLYFDGSSLSAQLVSLYHNVASSFDGINIFPNSGTITGTITTYGYKD